MREKMKNLYFLKKTHIESRFSRFWASGLLFKFSDWIPTQRNQNSLATILTFSIDLRCYDCDTD